MITIAHQQLLLHDAGHDPGPIDAIWGPRTQRAYDAWKKERIPKPHVRDIDGHEKLEGVHPDLIRVIVKLHLTGSIPFKVIEGVRSLARQKILFQRGSSKTMNSRHLRASNGYSHAVDIVPMVQGEISWHWPDYYPLAKAVKRAAQSEGVPIEWGGDWKNFVDGPHWQLPWSEYPK